MFGSEHAKLHAMGETGGGHTLPPEFNHARRNIAREDADPPLGKVQRVDSGTAIQFEDALIELKGTIQFAPHRLAAQTPDERSAEIPLVGFRRSVPVRFCTP